MSDISFNVNNDGTLDITQSAHDGAVHVISSGNGTYDIAPGDFVMLLNYYCYVKSNDIHCDFINPNGKRETCWTVAICNPDNHDADPWVSTFSSRSNADNFMYVACERLSRYKAAANVMVSIDESEVDSRDYLDWIDEIYGDETEID